MGELDFGRVVGYGVPADGAMGQIPVKASATDYDLAWQYPQYCRPNLLDDWYFVGGGSQLGDGVFPINQRGQTSYSGAVPSIDRWRLTKSNATLSLPDTKDRITISNTGTADVDLYQDLIAPPLLGKIVTFSALAFDGTLRVVTATIPTTLPSSYTIFAQIAGVIRIAGTGTHVRCQLYEGSWIACKLEIGNYQTLAHQENDVWVLNELPNFAEELAKCQRYQFKCAENGRIRACLVVTNSIQFFVPTPQQLVKAPSAASLSGCFVEGLAGGQQTGFTFTTFVSSGANGFMVSAAKTAHGMSDAVLNLNGALIYTE